MHKDTSIILNIRLMPILVFSSLFFIAFCRYVLASEPEATRPVPAEKRIVSLSPHLTELVYLLGEGEYLVAVSDYSDYPEEAQGLPSVVSYQGANLADIIRLQPTHVLAWKGGNKDADIAKLEEAGLSVYLSSVDDVKSLMTDIETLASFLGAPDMGKKALTTIQTTLQQLDDLKQNNSSGIRALYYLSETPFMALGSDSWINSLLHLCGIQNAFEDSLSPYPQISTEQILRQHLSLLIAANKRGEQENQLFWAAHPSLNQLPLINVDPDKMHRFTDRAITETLRLCQIVSQSKTN